MLSAYLSPGCTAITIGRSRNACGYPNLYRDTKIVSIIGEPLAEVLTLRVHQNSHLRMRKEFCILSSSGDDINKLIKFVWLSLSTTPSGR